METNAHRPRQCGTFRPHRLCLPLLAACLLLPAVAQADPPLYRVTSLGELSGDPNGGSSEAYALNDLGQVVGESLVQIQGSHPVHAFLWLPFDAYELQQGMHDLGLIQGDPVASNSEARDINESGQIVGTSNGRAFVWFPEYFGEPFLVKEPWPLPRFGTGEETQGWALDDGNPLRVVGWGVDGPCPDDARFNRELGFLWRSNYWGFLIAIAPPGDWTDSNIFAINPNATQRLVLGGSADYCGPFNDSSEYVAIGLDAGPTVSLILPPGFEGPHAQARDVTDEGELVGWAKDARFSNRDRALYWESVTTEDPVDLHTAVDPDIPSEQETRAEAIARPAPEGLPHVVGWNDSTDDALLWKRDNQGQWFFVDLNDLIGSEAQTYWDLRAAHDINNSAWIVGWGLHDGDHRAFLLSTAKDCPQDLDFDGDIDTSDLLILLGNWGYCPEGEICWSDIDMDGDVDTQDLLQLLSEWGDCDGTPGQIPRNVQDCIDKFGFDPVALEACIQAVTGGFE